MAKLVVFSHKPCWPDETSPTGYATDGGFPFQMRALSEMFEKTTLLLPAVSPSSRAGEAAITGHNLSVAPVSNPAGRGIWRKLGMLVWIARNSFVILGEIRRADAVHAPIPGDIGTIGMLLAFALRKPLFVRHCGNWFEPKTTAERFWKWFMERFAGGRNVFLATGGSSLPPSARNPNLHWIFSTSLTRQELKACSMRPFSSPTQSVRLIIACRQDKEKGTGKVIASMPYILKDFPQATLDVLGDGNSLEEFKQQAQALGLSDRVRFHGKVDHETVISRFQQADLFCYPTSASEGFPKVVLEALACGLPVVTTKVSVLPELIGNGCGILIDDTSPETIAAAVRECLMDADHYRSMSDRAVRTSLRYSLEDWRDTIGAFLRAAWAGRSFSAGIQHRASMASFDAEA